MYNILKWSAIPCMVGCLAVSAAEAPVRMDPVTITAPASSGSQGTLLTGDALSEPGAINAAEAITRIPGVSAVRRGADAAEPVIRGLGWERVTTQVGSHPMYGACPARMDPPATYLDPGSLQSIRVIKGIPSVTLGPGATGGKVILDTDYDRGPNAEPGYSGHARMMWDEGRDGFSAGLEARGGSKTVDARANVSATELDDYTSGGGVRVPAGLTEQSAALSLGWRPTDVSRLYGHAQFKHEEDVDFPSLSMDTEKSDSTILTLGYRTAIEGGPLERLEINAGYSYVDHLMNNRHKSNRKMMEAETPSKATSYSATFSTDWRLSDRGLLTLGMDAERVEREATRTRKNRMTGAVMKDPIWPDVERDLVGVFGEYNWAASEQLTLRAGARIDRAASEANDADQMMMIGPGNAAPVRHLYARFYGPEAANTDRDDTLYSGNVLAEWKSDGPWSAYVGAGRTERYPAVTELYYALSPAPGGYQVGNPALDTEKKYEINAGVRHQSARVDIECSVFAARIDDYILPTHILTADINADGQTDMLRGYRNVNAELYGGEMAATIHWADRWSLPVSLAYVQGRNTSDDRDFPEIPPLSGDAALRYAALEAAYPWWLQAGAHFEARQSKVDRLFPENETPSFIVAHLRGGISIKGVQLELGIENLFDEDYNEHLTREAALSTGSLAAGDEIPAPGRSVYVQATIPF